MRKTLLLAVAALAAAAVGTMTTEAAPEAALGVGDPAPAIHVAEWVQGDPIDPTDGNAVYLVEFWATWCPPCRESAPHLSELQAKYEDKGVVVAGISGEDENTVEKFVAEMGDKMSYAVGIDDELQSFRAYMQAAGVNTLPHAFVIGRDGKVAFIGHPMDPELEKTLDSLTSP